MSNKNVILHHDYLITLIKSKISSESKAEIDKIVQGFYKPPEWVPIEDEPLLIGITSSGGAMICTKCYSFWGLNYDWVVIPHNGDTKNTIIKRWKESKQWWKCPCCSFETLEN